MVKPAAVKVKMHLFSGLFVHGCHYAGCDQATKFSSKINRPPLSLSALRIPREMHPQAECLLSFIAPHLWQRTCSLFILFSMPPLLFPPSFWSYAIMPVLHSFSQPLPIFWFFILQFPSSFSVLLFWHAALYPSHLFPSLLSLIFCVSNSSMIFFPPSISLSVWPRHPVVWKLAHPGPAPEAVHTAPWVIGIVYSH